MDINKVPKQFCEQIQIGFNAEFFVTVMQTGENGTAYTLTPKHAKRLLQYLSSRISEYENEYGEIKTEWNPNIQSPIQIQSDGKDQNGNDKS